MSLMSMLEYTPLSTVFSVYHSIYHQGLSSRTNFSSNRCERFVAYTFYLRFYHIIRVRLLSKPNPF